jgi:erythromycin esterase
MFTRAIHSASIVLQAEDCLADFDACERDRYMADNVIWLLEQVSPDTKVILWAHNDHVADRLTSSGRRMGAYLEDVYGQDLLIVGLASGDEGSFNAITYEFGRLGGVDMHAVPESPRDSYESYFARAELERMVLDLRDVPAEDGAEWLTEPRGLRSIGAVYDASLPAEEYFPQVDITSEFDLLIYLEQTTPSLLLSLALLP